MSRVCLFLLLGSMVFADSPTERPTKITPGKVVIPTDRMRRIWGELVSLDFQTRTGVFRNEKTDELMPFTVLPYAELLHHATRGDLQDFRVGERALFRLHEDAEGRWTYLTYIQDELNFLSGHKEYYFVEAIDVATGNLTTTLASLDKTHVRESNVVLRTDADTRYWKSGKTASFADIQVGDKLLVQAHGAGKGNDRICWKVLLDDASRDTLRNEQQAVHRQRMKTEGLPGYVDISDRQALQLTLFPEGKELAGTLKLGQRVRISAAAEDRKASTGSAVGTVTAVQVHRDVHEVKIRLVEDGMYQPASVIRLWIE
ncbi:MAG TPA: hypothetical protein VM510_13840 [Caulifigura sp.]|jgi:hypothetical protein|nr:hypothetical protein [Caulifigura sp.]